MHTDSPHPDAPPELWWPDDPVPLSVSDTWPDFSAVETFIKAAAAQGETISQSQARRGINIMRQVRYFHWKESNQ